MNVVYARSTTSVAHGGLRITLHAGEVWDATDSVVAAYPDHFSAKPITVRRFGGDGVIDAPIEQATAAPGEKRSTRRAAK